MSMRACIKWMVITTVGSLLFGGIFVGSYGVWWSFEYKRWNDDAVSTYARIEAVEIANNTCYYKCNKYCFGNCVMCNNTCSDVFLNITYDRHHQRYQYLTNVTNYTVLIEQLSDCCRIGREIRIYYNKNNPHDISIELHSMLIFWVVIIFTVAITIICVTFVIFVYRRETTAFDYQRLYNDTLLAGIEGIEGIEAYRDHVDFPNFSNFPEFPEKEVILNY